MEQRMECKSTPLLSRFCLVGSLRFFIRHEDMLTLDGRYLFQRDWVVVEGCSVSSLTTRIRELISAWERDTDSALSSIALRVLRRFKVDSHVIRTCGRDPTGIKNIGEILMGQPRIKHLKGDWAIIVTVKV
ncbi:hypothetical protein Tco_0877693 [Tanacetum coccineum]|uniref:Uncharacterized protein n=1 Tax=Tanacetum coccineum TaxID=301880 RepID=A0ABQ5BYW6_9ASTR